MRRFAFLLLFGSSLANAEGSAVGAVSTSTPTVASPTTTSPKMGAVTTSKLSIASPTLSKITVGKVGTSQVKLAKESVSPVTFTLSGGGKGGGPLTEQEQALVDQASKDDLNWAKPGADNRQLLNGASSAENDAATKAYAAATDAGMDRSEAQRLAKAAREEVANGAPPPPPPPPPAPPAEQLPEVIDLSATTPPAPAAPSAPASTGTAAGP